MKLLKNALLVTSLLVATTSTAFAFDGDRKGWQIGIGIGVHSAQLDYTTEFAPTNVETQTKLAGAFQVGYGFSNRITGFIGGSGGSLAVDGTPSTLTIAGFGGTYYLNDSTPSFYVTGLFGQASLTIGEEELEFADKGPGWLVGVGYEVTHRLHLELSHSQAELTAPDNVANNTLVSTSFATAKYIWY